MARNGGGDGSIALLSRSGRSSALGKLTHVVPSFRVSEETWDGLERIAAQAGLGVTEFLRMMCDIRVHSAEKVASLEAERVRVVAGMSKKYDGK